MLWGAVRVDPYQATRLSRTWVSHLAWTCRFSSCLSCTASYCRCIEASSTTTWTNVCTSCTGCRSNIFTWGKVGCQFSKLLLQELHHHTLCLCSVFSLLFSHNLFCTVCFTSLPASCGHSPLLPVPFLLLHSSPTHRLYYCINMRDMVWQLLTEASPAFPGNAPEPTSLPLPCS